MKKIFLFAMIISQLTYPQTDNSRKISYEISVKSKNSGCFNTGTQNDYGFITGILLGNKEGIGSGVSNSMDWFFLNQLSDYSWMNVKEPTKLKDVDFRKKMFDSSNAYSIHDYVINYSFNPLKVKNDSIWVYCKYILYEKKSETAIGKFLYDVSYNEKYLSFPFNEESKFELWKTLFPLSEISIKFFFDSEIQNTGSEEIGLAASEKKIVEMVSNSQLAKNNLKMGMELLRMNKESDQIILQKNDYPLTSINKFYDSKSELKTTIYAGTIKLPLRIYNPEKQTAFENSKFSKHEQSFTITLIPISKEGDDFLFDLLIKKEINNGSMSYAKRVKIEVNNKIKLELQSSHLIAEDIVNGERFNLNLDEDYNPFVKDYLVISLEAEGVTKENLLSDNIKKLQENVEKTSQRSANRDKLIATLTSLVADAQSYYHNSNKKNKSFLGWKIPEVYNRINDSKFNVEIKENYIILTGTGKTIGNDGINPIEIIMNVSPDRIIYTSVVN